MLLRPLCPACAETPSPAAPPVPLGSAGQKVELFRGRVRILGRPASEVMGTVTLALTRSTELNWAVDVSDDTPYELYDEWGYFGQRDSASIELVVDDETIENVEAEFTRHAGGYIKSATLGDPSAAPLNHVVAAWVSGPRLPVQMPLHEHKGEHSSVWSGRWSIETQGWLAQFDERSDYQQAVNEARDTDCCVLTHSVTLTRKDGSTFDGKAAHELLLALQYGLSLAIGRWTSPVAPVGYDSIGRPLWSFWAPVFASPPKLSAGWWRGSRGQDLASYLDSFVTHWLDPLHHGPLRFASIAAIASFETGFLEQRVLTAYSALEMLSWVTEVLERGVSEKAHEGRPSSQRLRRLLRHARIPVEWPLGEPGITLKHYAQEQDCSDAVYALARVRHRIVHPRQPNEIYSHPQLLLAASMLATHYLNLILLHRLGYRDKVADLARLGGWHGDVTDVPWLEPAEG